MIIPARRFVPNRIVIGLALAALLRATPAGAYFEDVAVGARPLAMGGSSFATVEDATAYYWNPAGLAGLEGTELFATFGRPLGVADLYTGAFVVGGRVSDVGVAVAWHRFALSGVYAEDRLHVAAGRRIWTPTAGHVVDGGVTLKAGRVAFDGFRDPGTGQTVDYGSETRFSFDGSLRWHTPWKLEFAWTGRDLNQPRYEFVPGSGGAAVPFGHSIGAAFRWNRESTVTAAWNATARAHRSQLDLGIEVWFYDVFAIRSGLTDVAGIADPGTSPQRFQYTGGFGLRNPRWTLDAAVATNRDLGASYRFSLLVPLGRQGAP